MAQALEDTAIIPGDATPQRTITFEDCPRRVRVMFGGQFVADSSRVKLLREERYLPVYYFPIEDVRTDLLEQSERHTKCPYKGRASYWSVRVGDRVAENAVWSYGETIPGREELKNYMAFYWDRMDAWFEEDEEVYVHPRDPYHRVDALRSSRHVQVMVAGETVADTHNPVLLFETGLPTRYYIPKLDVRLDLLEPTETATRCPYKGKASYWSARVGDTVAKDIVWSYPAPIPECPKIENLLCFYNEKVEAIYVDGELQPKPKTPWS